MQWLDDPPPGMHSILNMPFRFIGPVRPNLMTAALLIFTARSAFAADPESWKWNDPKSFNITNIQHGTFESAAMKRTIGYNIYLPPQYTMEPERRFPVVYFLHGAGGTESSDAGLAYNVHAEVLAGRIAPMIYVFPNGGQTSGYRDSATNYVRTETMLIQELLPLIDKEYRTLAKPEARGICGFSMGGGGAMRLSLKYPGLFSAAASLAAAVEKTPEDSNGDNAFKHASALTKEQRERLRLYLVVGEDDFLYPRHAPFLKHLKDAGIKYTFVTHSQVGHDLGMLTKLSGDAMIRHLSREISTHLEPEAAK
jgi:endo-1,4-beta-xylanase